MPDIQPAYDGNESYIFISYAHKDERRVYPVVARMQEEGYRIWYDDGIKPSQNFSDDIAVHVAECSFFISFVSKKYVESEFCMNELEYAFMKKRKRLLVFLEDTQLPPGAELQNSSIQHILKYSMESDAKFYTVLFKTPALETCKADSKPVSARQADTAKAAASASSERLGSSYVGDMKDGKPHGHGRKTWSDGTVYIGEFVSGRRTGKGMMIWPDGTVYEGDFSDDRCHGKGKKTWANGTVYEGDFSDDQRTGKGILTWSDGTVYVGDFKDGKLTGKGKKTWANGTVYEGDWVMDQRTGTGRLSWPDGTVYEGEFREGKMHGHGKKTYPDGRVTAGRWEMGRFVG